MRRFKTVFMRGGTSKGCMFHKSDLPQDESQWDEIFLQVMGNPDPKQIDGLGGTVSSNNKIVIVWKSEEPGIDVEYLVGQVIVGKGQVDYKSNCGNMTAAVGPFAVEEGLLKVTEPVTVVHMKNKNTDKYIDVSVPCENGTFAETGDCKIAGVDGSSPELLVSFLNPAGAKTGKLLPTQNPSDILDIPGFGKIEVSLLDVSNPMVLVRASDIGMTGIELPDEVNSRAEVCELLEKIRGTCACLMGFAKDLEDAKTNSPAVPKVGFYTGPADFTDISGKAVLAGEMDICARVISVFRCHKACPLTSASSIAVAAFLDGTIIHKDLGASFNGKDFINIGHPSGVMKMVPFLNRENGSVTLDSVAVSRTARRIMDGTVYIKH